MLETKLRIVEGNYAGEDIDVLIKALLAKNKHQIDKDYRVIPLLPAQPPQGNINHYVLPAMSIVEGFGHLEALAPNIVGQNCRAQILIPYRLTNSLHWATVCIRYNNVFREFSIGCYDSLNEANNRKEMKGQFLTVLNMTIVKNKLKEIKISGLAPCTQKIQHDNSYCGGYTAHIIVSVALESLNEFIDFGSCPAIKLFSEPHRDDAYRKKDANFVMEHAPGSYSNYAVEGDGHQSREQEAESQKNTEQCHSQYVIKFKPLWEKLSLENKQSIQIKYRQERNLIIEELKQSKHDYQKAKIILTGFRDFCQGLGVPIASNPFGVFFKDASPEEKEEIQIMNDFPSIDVFIQNKLIPLFEGVNNPTKPVQLETSQTHQRRTNPNHPNSPAQEDEPSELFVANAEDILKKLEADIEQAQLSYDDWLKLEQTCQKIFFEKKEGQKKALQLQNKKTNSTEKALLLANADALNEESENEGSSIIKGLFWGLVFTTGIKVSLFGYSQLVSSLQVLGVIVPT